MGKSLMMASGLDTSVANTTEYLAPLGTIVFNPTEVQVQIPFREAGVISNLALINNSNTINAISNFRLRKNGANGNQIVPMAALTEGYFEDTTHTDTIAAGDTICISFTPGASTGTISIIQISFVFNPTNSSITHARYANTALISNNISENDYHTLSGILQNTTDTTGEAADILFTPKAAMTLKHFALYSSVAGNRAVALRVFKNSVDDAVNRCLIASGVTGLGEDSSTSVSLNGSTDTVAVLVGYGGGTTTRSVDFIATSLENTGNYFYFINGRADGNSENFGVTRYYHLGGRIINNTSETSVRQRARIPMRLTNLAIRVLSNTLNGDVVFTFRKNGADGNMTITIPAGNTGLFEDTTHMDQVTETDDINLKAVNGGSSGVIIYTLISTLAEYYPLQNLTRTITHSLAFSSSHPRLRGRTRSVAESLTFASSHPRLRNKVRNVANVLDSDNYEAGTYSFTEGGTSPNGKWTNTYLGGTGATSGVRTSDGDKVMFEKPQVSTSAPETHATLNMFNTTFGDFDLTVDLKNVAQLRTGSTPNAWETAWILFRFTDNWHHYYLALKTSGIELGRKDYATMIEQQIFLVTNATPFTVIGRWEYIRLRAIGNRFTVWVNGSLAFDFVDDGSTGYDTNTGLTPAPPSAAMYSGKIGLYNEDAEVEFNNFSVAEVNKLTFSTTQPRYRGRARTIAQTLGFTSSHSRLTNRLRTIAQSLGFTSNHLRLKTKLPRTIAQSLTFSSNHLKLENLVRTISQSLAFSAAFIQESEMIRTIFETLTFTSNHVRSTTRLRTITQSLTFSSNHVRLRGFVQTISNSLNFVATIIKQRNKIRTISHTLGFSSSHTWLQIGTKIQVIAESLNMSADFVVERFKSFYIKLFTIKGNK